MLLCSNIDEDEYRQMAYSTFFGGFGDGDDPTPTRYMINL
jgi:hypothetical protein